MSSTEYTIDNIPQHELDRVIISFRVVAHRKGPILPGGTMSQNHWSIYLIHAGGSVRLSMGPKDGWTPLSNGRALEVKSFSHIGITNSAVKHWDFTAAGNLSVRHVIQLIQHNNLQKYETNDVGVGCRY